MTRAIQASEAIRTSLEARVFIALFKLRTISAASRAIMKQHGLTGTQYNVLRILAEPSRSACPAKASVDRMISRDPT